jgi:hypothetical protein
MHTFPTSVNRLLIMLPCRNALISSSLTILALCLDAVCIDDDGESGSYMVGLRGGPPARELFKYLERLDILLASHW